ncbi:hypothetical protein CROQUDRAFT_684634 [Cronartium quercuum f. sp. fusiforme G11]|uniref:Uncharacterized protein n=1 Tax=Cronartium quercuum f. sp. fusiforme G11 TaxID=708437 RepID=A0A9P6NSZ3_9BASI|nr:hypothetical protein CROQUDRAFT_684634 [Cronartium quercuum f. sp. fusiforme G11]
MMLYYSTKAVIHDPTTYQKTGWSQVYKCHECQLMEPALFLDEICKKVYNETGVLASPVVIDWELQEHLQLTLKKAGVSNVLKNLHAKAIFMHQIAEIPSEFFVFTDKSAICDLDLLQTRQHSKKGLCTTCYVPCL